jgi:nitrate/TMAO reductase-like tetraheme cytochrome c subunit
MTNFKRRIIIALAGSGLTLLLIGLAPFLVSAQETTPSDADETTADGPAWIYQAPAEQIEATGDNAYCRLCHSQPWRSANLPDGSILNLFVSEEVLAASVHGLNNPQGPLGCTDCHGDAAFPHSGPPPATARSFTLDAVSMCVSCHSDQLESLQHSLHVEAILEGNTQAAVCTDCHGAHDVRRVVEQRGLVAGVCGDCHTSTLTEFQVSAHSDIGPLGCGTCHDPHSQQMRIGGEPSETCVNCHKDVSDVWVHTTHLVPAGASETAANRTNVTCVDCHMYVPHIPETATLNYGLIPTGHTMLLDSQPCTACHANTSAQSLNITDAVTTGGILHMPGTGTTGSEDDLIEVCVEGEEACEEETGTGSITVSDDVPQEEEVLDHGAPSPDYIQLLQGLILGIGFGITGAAIFITRGNRSASSEE